MQISVHHIGSVVAVALLQTLLCVAQADTSTAVSPWNVHAIGYAYVTPAEGSYPVPVITAQYEQLHLEARYNYENFETASLWVGTVFAWEGTVEGFVTPMLGAVFGRTSGLAPGLEGSLRWNLFRFYVEGEYFIDPGVRSNAFLYYWTELSATVLPWLDVGAASQRTRLIYSYDEFVAGPFIGYHGHNPEFRLHVFEPGDANERYYVFSVDVML